MSPFDRLGAGRLGGFAPFSAVFRGSLSPEGPVPARTCPDLRILPQSNGEIGRNRRGQSAPGLAALPDKRLKPPLAREES